MEGNVTEYKRNGWEWNNQLVSGWIGWLLLSDMVHYDWNDLEWNKRGGTIRKRNIWQARHGIKWTRNNKELFAFALKAQQNSFSWYSVHGMNGINRRRIKKITFNAMICQLTKWKK